MIKLNDSVLNFSEYPNGETVLIDLILPHVHPSNNFMVLKYEDDLDLFRLLLVKGWLDDLSASPVNLYMPYVPYSRMDRSELDSGFSLKYLARFINGLDFQNVFVDEVHSSKSLELLERVRHCNTSVQIADFALRDIEFDTSVDYLLYPDVGAQERYGDFFANINILVASKNRDFATGEILGLVIDGDENLNGGKVLIIDDLCSAGGSFYYSALELYKMGAGSVFLAVTHCEDTIHKGKLLDGNEISRIYASDSLLTLGHDKITIVDIELEN